MCIEDKMKDMPQLVVALNSNNDKAEYVYITNAKEDIQYYCPCCMGEVKPRAYKDNKDYLVQPHFYHVNGGCSEESYVHYVCEMFLSKKNCKFKVSDKEYIVENIDVEKTYHTKFGDYRPDVTIITKDNKIFFAEISYSNKKSQEYISKWDELENDVIEIDARYFINLIMDNKIPDFKLIYSNGECLIKSYSHEDYERFIVDRKMRWKRKEWMNYKIQWERLDWFFTRLQQYKLGNIEFGKMINSFKQVDKEDKAELFDLIKKQSCLKGERDYFRDIINNEATKYYEEKVKEYKEKEIKITGKIENCKRFKVYYSFKDFRGSSYCGDSKWIININDLIDLFNRISNWKETILYLKDIKNKVNRKRKCIWKCELNDKTLKIGIKNHELVSDEFGYYPYFSIYIDEYLTLRSEKTLNDTKIYSKDNLKAFVEKGMEEIIELVNKKDGIGRDYRYFIVSKEDLNE